MMYQLPSRLSLLLWYTHPWHLIPELVLCAVAPNHCDNAGHDGAHDGGVGLPVVRLGVPASGGRPDVLWVAIRYLDQPLRVAQKQSEMFAYGILPPPLRSICVTLIVCGVEGSVYVGVKR